MKITVVGAGFSGLVTAYYLRRQGLDVEIVEILSEAGGLIRTHKTEYGLVETAANGLLSTERVENLFSDLGVPILRTKSTAKNRYIFRGWPRRWPLGFLETFAFLAKVLLIAVKGWRKTLAPRPNETVSHWCERHFGKHVLNHIVAPALQGIYAGDVSRMSASLVFGKLFQPSSSKKKLRTVTAPQGMGQLIQALQDWLVKNGVDIKFDTSVQWDPKLKNWRWVLATGPHQAAKILKPHPASRLLESIEVSPLVTVTAFYHPLDAKLRGFGVLFPRSEKVRALGMRINSDIFEGHSDVRSETWIYGGATDNEVTEWKDFELLSQLSSDRAALEGFTHQPIDFKIQRWKSAIPHYTVQLEKILGELPTIENTHLVGNYLGGIGLAKILDLAHEVATKLAAESKHQFTLSEKGASRERGAIY